MERSQRKPSPTNETQNKPDLETCVLQTMFCCLKNEQFKKEIFGQIAAYTYTIEFHKSRLPRTHFLIILKPCSELYSTNFYDHIVCAKLPDGKKIVKNT